MPRPERRDLMILAGLTALALALRIFHIDYRSLNGGDEPFSLALAQRPFGDMISLFGYESNGTVYSLILWPLIRIGGESEALLRSPAVLAGTLAVPAVWWAGRELVSDRAALMAAALMAVSPMAIFQSQNARPFALVILLAPIAFAALAIALRDPRRRWWALYVGAMVLLGYSNALTPFALLPAQLVMVNSIRPERMRAWLLSLLPMLALMIPLFVMLATARGRRDPLYWLDTPGPREVVVAFEEFATGMSGAWAAFTLIVLVSGVAFLAAAREKGRWRLPAPASVLAWAFLPVLTLVAFSYLTPAFRAAYAVAVLPGLLLLMAACLDRFSRPIANAGLGALIALTLVATAAQTTTQVDETWRSAIGWLKSEYRPGDRLLVDIPAVFPVFGYYDDRFKASNDELIVDEWGDNPIPRGVYFRDDPGGYSGPPGPPGRRQISQLARGDRRLFVFLSEYVDRLQGDIPNGDALRWARKNCKVTQRDETDISAYLITGCPKL